MPPRRKQSGSIVLTFSLGTELACDLTDPLIFIVSDHVDLTSQNFDLEQKKMQFLGIRKKANGNDVVEFVMTD